MNLKEKFLSLKTYEALFEELHKETKEKLRILASMIDEKGGMVI